MSVKLRRKAKARKHKMLRRIDKNNWSGTSPMIRPQTIKYEIADKQKAIAAGGIGTLLELTKQLDLRKEINRTIPGDFAGFLVLDGRQPSLQAVFAAVSFVGAHDDIASLA